MGNGNKTNLTSIDINDNIGTWLNPKNLIITPLLIVKI